MKAIYYLLISTGMTIFRHIFYFFSCRRTVCGSRKLVIIFFDVFTVNLPITDCKVTINNFTFKLKINGNYF